MHVFFVFLKTSVQPLTRSESDIDDIIIVSLTGQTQWPQLQRCTLKLLAASVPTSFLANTVAASFRRL